MKNIYVSLCLSLIFLASVSGQVTFQRTVGGANSDIGQSIQQTTDGGYIIVGYTSSFGAGNSDVYLIKTDALGNMLWAKTYGGAGNEVGKCVRQTTDGGYIVAGWSDAFGQGGGGDLYYFKTDGSGNLLWSKTFGGPSLDLASCCQQTVDGGYAIFGWTATYGAGEGDFYLVKTDANGTVQWNKTYGWSGDEYGLWFEQTADHGYIMTGTTNSKGDGVFDDLIIKSDSVGGLVWAKTYGGLLNDGGSFIQQTSDGGYINVGSTLSFGAGNDDVYLIRTDANGDTLWTRTYGGVNKDVGNCVRQDANGNFIVSATYASGANSKGWLFKTDGNGATLWSKFYGGNKAEDSFTFWQTNDNGFAITGQTTSFGAGMQDVYIIKTDSAGNSSCNDTTHEVVITSLPPTVVTGPVPFVGSGGISTNPATIVHNGGTVDSLCSSAVNVPFPFFQSSDTILCANDCISFTDLSTNNPTSWLWSFPGGLPSSSTDQNPQYVCYLTAGTYNVTLVATNANGSNTLMMSNFIVVHPAPQTPVITNLNDTLLHCSTDPSYTSYQWYNDSVMIPGATDTLLRITHGGNYNVKVTNEFGCSIAVGINIVGILDFDSDNFIYISPNPVSDKLYVIGYTLYDDVDLIIFNTVGEIVQRSLLKRKGSGGEAIDVSKLSAGIYFLQLRSESGSTVKKFVKE